MIWRAQDYRRVVSAYVRSNFDPGFGTVLRLTDARCRRTLVKTVCGKQVIVLRDLQRVAQVGCVGEDIRIGPFALEVVVDGFPDVEGPQRLIRRLAGFFRNDHPAAPDREWTVEAKRHRDALAAFDLMQRNCRYREIAAFLYGEQRVCEEWSNPDRTLKNRTIRSCKRAMSMVGGGYRSLLG